MLLTWRLVTGRVREQQEEMRNSSTDTDQFAARDVCDLARVLLGTLKKPWYPTLIAVCTRGSNRCEQAEECTQELQRLMAGRKGYKARLERYQEVRGCPACI